MTSWRRLASPWTVVAALLVVLLAIGIEVGVLADIISPSVWLDVIALWPIGAIGLVAAPIVWLIGDRQPRHLAIAGLSVFTWLAVGFALHVSGSELLPVGVTAVEGPDADDAVSGHLEIELEAGRVDLEGGAIGSYRVSPIRAGGVVGAPSVFEQSDGAELRVVVVPRDDPGMYVFRGWTVSLGSGLRWTIDVAAPELSVDLTGVDVTTATLRSDASEIAIGPVSAASVIDLVGTHRVVVAEGTPIRLQGEGVVPDDWILIDGGGARSPVDGEGWLVVAEGGSHVEIWYR